METCIKYSPLVLRESFNEYRVTTFRDYTFIPSYSIVIIGVLALAVSSALFAYRIGLEMGMQRRIVWLNANLVIRQDEGRVVSL